MPNKITEYFTLKKNNRKFECSKIKITLMLRKIILSQSASMSWAIIAQLLIHQTLGQQQYFNCINFRVGPMLAKCQHANNSNHYRTLAQQLIAIWYNNLTNDLVVTKQLQCLKRNKSLVKVRSIIIFHTKTSWLHYQQSVSHPRR